MRSQFEHVLVIALALAAGTASGQSERDVQEWLEREVSAARRLPLLGRYSLAWRTEDFSTLTDAELAALKAETANKPDHPRRGEYEAAMQRVSQGPSVIQYQLFCAGDEKWRLNTQQAKDWYLDAAMTPNHAWQSSADALKVFDLDDVATDPEQRVGSHERVFRPILNRLLHGGIGVSGISDLQVTQVTVTGGHWAATLGRPAHVEEARRFAVEFRGRWLSDENRGLVEQTTISSHGSNPAVVGEREIYSGWERHAEVGGWIAGRVERHLASGALARATIFEAILPLPEGDSDAVFMIPPVLGSDAIRGPTTFRSIFDFSEKQVTQIDAQGARNTHPMKPSDQSGDHDWLRYSGWTVLGVLGTVLIVVIARRRMSATSQ